MSCSCDHAHLSPACLCGTDSQRLNSVTRGLVPRPCANPLPPGELFHKFAPTLCSVGFRSISLCCRSLTWRFVAYACAAALLPGLPFDKFVLTLSQIPLLPPLLPQASSDLLFTPSMVEGSVESRLALASGLAHQWFGCLLLPRTPEDAWLVAGLAAHLEGQFVRQWLGSNELAYR